MSELAVLRDLEGALLAQSKKAAQMARDCQEMSLIVGRLIVCEQEQDGPYDETKVG